MQERESARRSNAERRERTVAALIGAARTLFLEKGYAETGTPEVVRRASVTRGALYHHFADKLDLFRAVIRAEALAVAEEIGRRTGKDMEPVQAMTEGAEAYFDAMAAPGRAHLLLVEGPAVLGRAEMDAIDGETGGEELRLGLQALADSAGAELPIEATAALLSAMFDRAALAIAGGADPGPYREAIAHILRRLV